jgi:crotonobetainyl-CoA:carnitine CoA-transferase CaiB-like acyl-CoA transferase
LESTQPPSQRRAPASTGASADHRPESDVRPTCTPEYSPAVTSDQDSLLAGLKVVDLAGEPAAMTCRILADLGAQVIKVEPEGGDPLRRVVPLDADGSSLRFGVWNAGETTLEVDGPDDERLSALLGEADAVVDTPGWPGSLHVDPDKAPQAVWVSVTPFGLEGPRSRWQASDLGVMASTGNMYCTGDPDRAPVRCTEPTAWAHVGPEAAMATLTALASGRPQRVDVSIQEVVMIASMGHVGRFPRTGSRGRRSGANVGNTREIWPCADGFVSFGLRGGRARVANLQTITRLVEEDGVSTPALSDRDWTTYDHTKMSPEQLEEISAPIAAYFERHNMAELYEIACETNLMLAPANSPRELIESKQLAERDFFCTLEGLGTIPRTFVHVRSPDDAVVQPGARLPAKPAKNGVHFESHQGSSALGSPPEDSAAKHSAAKDSAAKDSAAGKSGAGLSGANENGAWSGTTIIEFGTGAAGPIAVRYFAEHGATVIRIESRTRPDFLRTYGSNGPHGLEGSDMFDSLNVGKLGITLNLKSPEGAAIALNLIKKAGTVAENYAPRAMRGFGLDYTSVAKEVPELVMVSSCLQGQTGPHRDYPGFGGQGSALGGYNILTGWPDREPIGPFGTITDSLAPRFVASALAAGLLYKRRTGKGVYLDVSQAEAAVYSLSPWIADYSVNGNIRTRQGNRSNRFSPHGVYPCPGDDRWVAIASVDDESWRNLAGVLGIDARDVDRLGSLDARIKQSDEIDEIITSWTSERDAAEVAEMLQKVGVEAIPVADLGDAFNDSQLIHRSHFVPLSHPLMGECFYERNGFRLSDEDAGYVRTSPLLGEHNEMVLGEILGMSSGEIGRLREEGILE